MTRRQPIAHPCIHSAGEPTHVVVPIDEYRRLLDAATTRAVVRAQQVEADPQTQWHDGESVLRGLVASRLATIRKSQGLSQRALAAKAGIPQSHLSRIERAPEHCTMRVLERLAKALGVPRRELV